MSGRRSGISGLFTCCLALVQFWVVSGIAAAAVPAEPTTAVVEDAGYSAAILEWRRQRHERLSSEDGWLTLVGLEWLQQGRNLVGSGAHNDIRLPGGPADWGTVILNDREARFIPDGAGPVTVDGMPAHETVLIPDTEGEPTIVRGADLSFYVIDRGSYALRVKDRRAPTLLAFTGVDNFPIDPSWRIDARFLPAAAGTTIDIANVLGQSEQMRVGGVIEFERDGRTHSLLGLQAAESDSLWFLFADRSSGRETYGAGRFLYSDGMPANGRVVVDFNKAYNPPCAFNDYSTCPLPPQQNRLDLAVTAGEKDYHHD